MSYVDKEALERKIHTGMTIIQAMQVIMDEPAADVVEVRHGQWLDALVIDLPTQLCDQCNTFFPLAYTGGGHRYCPNCGAKMDGGGTSK